MSEPPAEPSGALAPLRYTIFRWIWFAAMASSVGTWMQNVGAAWLMTRLSPSPLLVALVQTATTLPVFLLGVPAGALADLVDRRKLLLLTQAWMLIAAALLGALTIAGRTGPWTLLLLTFALGLGSTMTSPAWQATVPQLVPRQHLPAAVALNSVQFNIARSIGPALGGLIIAVWNTGAVFVLNALSFLGVMFVLYNWKNTQQENGERTEGVVSAMWAGLRYVRYAPSLHGVLVRSGAFVACASALWAMLPLVAAHELRSNASGYGVLLGCLGVGSVIGAGYFSRIRIRWNADTTILIGTLLFAVATLALALLNQFWLVAAAMLVGGVAWMTVMSIFNVAAQLALPAWVRARGLSVYILVFQGALAVGSWVWGEVATHISTRTSLLISAAGLLGGLIIAFRYRLTQTEEQDLTPAMHWPEPTVMFKLEPDEGPVLVQVEYHVSAENAREFVQAVRELGKIRRRDGGLMWGIFEDTAQPGRYLESFTVESWAEHLRQHERVTVSDRAVEQRVNSLHEGADPPKVTHLVMRR